MKPIYIASAFLLSFALVAHTQSPATTAAEPEKGSSTATTEVAPKDMPPVKFHSDLLDLTFTYPGSLIATTLPSLEEQHAQTIAKYPDESAESKRTDECTDVALRATREDDPNKGNNYLDSTISQAENGGGA